MPRLDLDLVRHALTTAQRLGYREVEIGLGEDHFHAQLAETAPKQAAPGAATALGLHAQEETETIKAPFVGFFREAAKAMTEGDRIEKGDVIGVIEALGIANDVESRWSGRISEVLVLPDQPVEFGQPLARIVVGG